MSYIRWARKLLTLFVAPVTLAAGISVPVSASTPRRLSFGQYEVDLHSGELLKHGKRVRLQTQPFQLLVMLLERPGELVTREQICQRLWSANTFVDFDHSLGTAINKIREVLNDSAAEPRFVETLPRRGYRFIAPVTTVAESPATAPEASPAPSADSEQDEDEWGHQKASSRSVIWAAASVVLLVSALVAWYFLRAHPLTAFFLWQSRHPGVSRVDSASPRAVAVLPFQNAGSDKATDFLRLALPDEIATTLSYLPSFSIRPFATTGKYSGSNLDLQQAGREMGVTSIVTGHYLTEGDQLEITLEAVDVANNRSIWRDTISVAASDKIAMRDQVTSRVRAGLVPVLGGSSTLGEAGTRPKSEEAYDLYLRSIAVPRDAAANRDAIAMLERAVSIDSNYAPAWSALAERYYYDGDQSGGGKPMLKRSASATERALALDPGLIEASAQLIVNRAEEGELWNAYAEAEALVKRRPESFLAHHVLGYALRYAGLLDDSARECDTASKLDRSDYQIRSCSFVFFEQGKSVRAMEFLDRDAGSEWSNAVKVSVLMREGKMPEARQAAQLMTDNPGWMRKLLQACLNEAPAAEVHRLAELAENELLAEPDPEDKYYRGAIMAACGEKQIAYKFLRTAVAENYCAYIALQSDPLLAKVRGTPEFSGLLLAAKECQNSFLAQRDQSPQ